MVSVKIGSFIAGLAMASAFVFLFCASAHAQTGIELLVKNWEDNTSIEMNDLSGSFYAPGHEEDEPGRFTLNQVQSDGRARFGSIPGVAEGQKLFYVGYSVNYLDLSSHGPLLPDRLLDSSVAVGFPLAQFSGNNILAFSGGVGYAGDNPFAQRTGSYGKGDLLFVHEFEPGRELAFGLDYDGNRTADPDIPIPGFGYRASLNPNINYVVGFPYDSVEWRPWKFLTLSADYEFPQGVSATVSVRPIRKTRVFLTYRQEQDGFHIDDEPYDRRLFFLQQRAELGAEFIPVKDVELIVAAGYAFDQRFYSGFDLSNLDIVTAVSDVPYVRCNVTMWF
jgi:hypothetical protein